MDFNIGTKCWQDNCEEFETMIKMLIQNLGMLKVGAERLLMVKGGETPTGNHLPLTDIHRFMIRNDARILHLSICVHTLFEWNRVLTKNFCCELLTQNYKHSDNVAKNDVLVWEMNEKLRDARIRKAIDLFVDVWSLPEDQDYFLLSLEYSKSLIETFKPEVWMEKMKIMSFNYNGIMKCDDIVKGFIHNMDYYVDWKLTMLEYSEEVEKFCSEILDIILPDENNKVPTLIPGELVTFELCRLLPGAGEN